MAKGKEAGQGSALPEGKSKGKEAKPLLETKGQRLLPRPRKLLTLLSLNQVAKKTFL